MRLTQVEITNYRSIESMVLDFSQHRAIGLVGVNESGKSNILKALSLVSPDQKSGVSDVRMRRPSDDDVDVASVVFSFELSQSEVDSLVKEMEKVAVSRYGKLPNFTGSSGSQTFEQFAASRNTGFLIVNLLDSSAGVYTEALDEVFQKIEGRWVDAGSSPTTPPIEVSWLQPSTYKLLPNSLIKFDDFDPPLSIPFSEVGATEIDRYWQDRIAAYVKMHMPAALLWSYDKENLLPSSVVMEAFCADPRSCRPLQSMFEIAGIANIAADIAKAKARGRDSLDNLLSLVSQRAARHIREVWKDYKAASIELQLDGPDIRISVKDESLKFPFAERSDGFKRFMTFLLLVSAKVKTNSLENVLLLIDEPEISLHPAGVRNLRDELLRISEKNLVVFATHSPHMIDRRCIDRHIIVKKVNEITKCELAGGGKVFDEEVLLNSLGVSVFEALKPNNLLFEGWRDKKLFEVFLHGNKKEPAFGALLNVGTAFVTGVKDVRNVVPLMALANAQVLVVSDHDNPALEARKLFMDARFDSEWLTYRELEGGTSEAMTAEDFVKPAALRKAFEALCKTHAIAATIEDATLQGNNRLAVLEARLKASGVGQELIKPRMNELKSLIFDNIKSSSIDERYTAVGLGLAAKLTVQPLVQ